MFKTPRLLPLIAALSCAGSISIARADEPADGPAAESLFMAGRALMDVGNFKEACPKLAESERLDPTLGTLLNLAKCHEGEGKTATSWNEYRTVAALALKAGDTERAAVAKDLASKLEPSLVYLRIDAERTAGLVIRRDEVEVRGAVLGTEIAIDPGPHAIVASAAGYNEWKTQVDLVAGMHAQVKVPPLIALPKATEPLVRLAPKAQPVLPPPEADSAPARRTAGWVLIAGGGAGLAVGAITGAVAIQKHSALVKECGAICNAQQEPDRKSYYKMGTASTAGFIVGGVLATTGIILVATGGRRSPPTAISFQLSPGYMALKQEF